MAALIGGANIVWTTFFLFIISSIFMFMIKIDTSINNSRKNNSSVGHFEVMREGWHAIWHKPVLRIISITDMIGTIASVVWMAAIVLVFVHQALRVNESWWGFINFSFFAGLIVGGLISIRLSDHINKHLKVVSLVGLFMTGIATMLFGWNTFPLLALIFSAVVGIFDQLRNVTFETLIQTNTKSDLLAQVYSAQDAMYSLSYGIATLVFGYLTDKIGVQLVFTLSSGLLFISFIYVMGSKNYLVKPEDVRADE
ncbi:hypothetical protein St703_30130 [Sporolactobacillus terrae]|uniref:Major facilitator superfamily (MFS) profile domain-containing protein n=1 Tax=Sporolactobacillus terrae TaxID=269673 RepID=A0A5K7X5P1_9BACL|nr:hypothetical protein St703_30130 [Sporolactobacillus terrae]